MVSILVGYGMFVEVFEMKITYLRRLVLCRHIPELDRMQVYELYGFRDGELVLNMVLH